MENTAILETEFDLPIFRRGKVRDVYQLGDRLLVIATDRISAFDVVLSPGIPDKGKVLNQLSNFWFDRFAHVVPHHIQIREVASFPPELRNQKELLAGRSVIVRRTKPLPVECVARGYLIGSGWKDYEETGAICGLALPAGLRQGDRLPEPLFTPSTKADEGHDENISFEEVCRLLGRKLASRLRELTLTLYQEAARYALERGIIIADTKLEFGLDPVNGSLVWIDEALTPDSSRFWPAATYSPGASPPSFDKQYVRDWLEESGWSKAPPAPDLPIHVVQKTREKYLEAHRRLTGLEPVL